MTTNRGRKDVIRDRMAATGESYNVAARNLKAMKDTAATRAAVLVQRWDPAESLDVPCPCGSTCEPGGTCDRCHARHRHVKRYPGSVTDVEVWADRYECLGCPASYTLTVRLPGRPWGVAGAAVRGGAGEEAVQARVFPGVAHPLLRAEVGAERDEDRGR
ncbi:hypothetical protein [Streptomyces nitrosporeus]|uniref:hypothetical protein n=1 Tax=Streptomyces nitrosporeus TaxID=28894 RepID=UPI0039A31B98